MQVAKLASAPLILTPGQDSPITYLGSPKGYDVKGADKWHDDQLTMVRIGTDGMMDSATGVPPLTCWSSVETSFEAATLCGRNCRGLRKRLRPRLEKRAWRSPMSEPIRHNPIMQDRRTMRHYEPCRDFVLLILEDFWPLCSLLRIPATPIYWDNSERSKNSAVIHCASRICVLDANATSPPWDTWREADAERVITSWCQHLHILSPRLPCLGGLM